MMIGTPEILKMPKLLAAMNAEDKKTMQEILDKQDIAEDSFAIQELDYYFIKKLRKDYSGFSELESIFATLDKKYDSKNFDGFNSLETDVLDRSATNPDGSLKYPTTFQSKSYPSKKWLIGQLRNNLYSRVDYPVLEMMIIGSEARGIAKKDSDIDVAVIIPGSTRISAIKRTENYHAKFSAENQKPTWNGRIIDFQFFYPSDEELKAYDKIKLEDGGDLSFGGNHQTVRNAFLKEMYDNGNSLVEILKDLKKHQKGHDNAEIIFHEFIKSQTHNEKLMDEFNKSAFVENIIPSNYDDLSASLKTVNTGYERTAAEDVLAWVKNGNNPNDKTTTDIVLATMRKRINELKPVVDAWENSPDDDSMKADDIVLALVNEYNTFNQILDLYEASESDSPAFASMTVFEVHEWWDKQNNTPELEKLEAELVKVKGDKAARTKVAQQISDIRVKIEADFQKKWAKLLDYLREQTIDSGLMPEVAPRQKEFKKSFQKIKMPHGARYISDYFDKAIHYSNFSNLYTIEFEVEVNGQKKHKSHEFKKLEDAIEKAYYIQKSEKDKVFDTASAELSDYVFERGYIESTWKDKVVSLWFEILDKDRQSALDRPEANYPALTLIEVIQRQYPSAKYVNSGFLTDLPEDILPAWGCIFEDMNLSQAEIISTFDCRVKVFVKSNKTYFILPYKFTPGEAEPARLQFNCVANSLVELWRFDIRQKESEDYTEKLKWLNNALKTSRSEQIEIDQLLNIDATSYTRDQLLTFFRSQPNGASFKARHYVGYQNIQTTQLINEHGMYRLDDKEFTVEQLVDEIEARKLIVLTKTSPGLTKSPELVKLEMVTPLKLQADKIFEYLNQWIDKTDTAELKWVPIYKTNWYPTKHFVEYAKDRNFDSAQVNGLYDKIKNGVTYPIITENDICSKLNEKMQLTKEKYPCFYIRDGIHRLAIQEDLGIQFIPSLVYKHPQKGLTRDFGDGFANRQEFEKWVGKSIEKLYENNPNGQSDPQHFEKIPFEFLKDSEYGETVCATNDISQVISMGWCPCADGTDHRFSPNEIRQLQEIEEGGDTESFVLDEKLKHPLNWIAKMKVEGNTLLLPTERMTAKEYADVKSVMQKAGGTYRKNAFVFEEPGEDVYMRILGGEDFNLKKKFQYFPTPDATADMMVRLADIKCGMTFLEPSAGRGSIIKAIHRVCPDAVVEYYEIMEINRKFLKAMPSTREMGLNFEDVMAFSHIRAIKHYDRIIANPPFSKNQDENHIQLMYELLNPGGRLVSVSSTHWQFAAEKQSSNFRNWIKTVNAEIIEVPPGTFKESGTMVPTLIIVISKPK